MPGQMFLRTALTERRIDLLEDRLNYIYEHLGLSMPTKSDGDWDEPFRHVDPPKPKPEPEPEPEPPEPEPEEEKRPLSKIAKRVARAR